MVPSSPYIFGIDMNENIFSFVANIFLKIYQVFSSIFFLGLNKFSISLKIDIRIKFLRYSS